MHNFALAARVRTRTSPLTQWRGLPFCRASCRDSEEDPLLVEAKIHDRGHVAKCNKGSDIAAGIRDMPGIAPACRRGRWFRGKSFAERPEPDAPDGRCASCPLHGPAFFSALFRVPMYDEHALCIGVSAARLMVPVDFCKGNGDGQRRAHCPGVEPATGRISEARISKKGKKGKK